MADIKSIITAAAGRYGIDPNIAITLAHIESTFDPRAHNPSGASGLFQFMPKTWGQYGNGANVFDPEANADAGMRFTRDNINILKSKLGREPSAGEVYLAHQQGAGGALQLLSNPDAPASQIVGRRAVTQNGGSEAMTASQFANLWISKADKLNGTAPASTMNIPMSMENSNNPGDYSVHSPSVVGRGDTSSTQSITMQDQAAMDKAAAEAPKPSLLEGAGIAIKNNWSILTPFQMQGAPNPQPNYLPTKEKLDEITKDIPTDYIDEFDNAVSDEHLETIRNHIMIRLQDNEKLASLGASGTILSLGAALTDPGAIAAVAAISAATGGLGGPAFMAARLGRAGRIAYAAAEGAAVNVAIDAPLIAIDPTRDVNLENLKWSIGIGMMMGGAMGAFKKNPMFQQEAADMTKQGKTMATQALDESLPQPTSGSAGAAAVMGDSFSMQTRNDLDDFAAIKVAGSSLGVRWDSVAALMKSKNPMLNVLARYLGEDAVRAQKGSGVMTTMGATEISRKRFVVASKNWSVGYRNAFKEYKKANNINFFNSKEAEKEFNQHITSYLRTDNGSLAKNIPKEAAQAAEVFRSEMRAFWKEASDLGLTRSENGVKDYFPRYPHLAKASKLIHDFGFSKGEKNIGLTQLFKDAILKEQADLDPDLAEKMGYAILDRMQKLHSGEDRMGGGQLGFSIDDLRTELSHHMSDDEIANVEAFLSRNQKDTSSAARMQHRIILDENFSGNFRDKYDNVHPVNISDFYVSDPNIAFNLYARNMSGNLAMAKMQVRDPKTGALLIDGIKSTGDWQALKKRILAAGSESGADNETDMKNLDFLYSAITGTPIPGRGPEGSGEQFLRMLRDFNFARLMGQVGFSQIPEFARKVSQVGLKTLFQSVPSFRHLVDMARSGKMTDELAEEIDNAIAPGSDWERGYHYMDTDDLGTPITRGADTVMSKVHGAVGETLHNMNRIVAMGSGMVHVNRVLQKLAGRMSVVKFVKMAAFNDKINWERMRALGLDKKQTAAIFESIRTHAEYKGGVKRPSALTKLGLEKWDANTRASFEQALFRLNRNMIMENDAGMMHRWMAHPLGQTFMQFRSFTFGAWTKGTLQGINMRDQEAAMGILGSSMLGAMVYGAQTHLNLIGDPDRERKIKERLTWENMAKAGLSRSSESSILPMLFDTGATTLGFDPQFSYRSSGLASQATDFTANPTTDLIGKAGLAISGISSAVLQGDDYSQPDFKNLTTTLPFQRMMGAVQFYNWLGSGLPQREMRN